MKRLSSLSDHYGYPFLLLFPCWCLYAKTIILPRQARDRHSEKAHKRKPTVFADEGWGSNVPQMHWAQSVRKSRPNLFFHCLFLLRPRKHSRHLPRHTRDHTRKFGRGKERRGRCARRRITALLPTLTSLARSSRRRTTWRTPGLTGAFKTRSAASRQARTNALVCDAICVM